MRPLSGTFRNEALVGTTVSVLPCRLILADLSAILLVVLAVVPAIRLEVLMIDGVGGLCPMDDGFHSSPPKT